MSSEKFFLSLFILVAQVEVCYGIGIVGSMLWHRHRWENEEFSSLVWWHRWKYGDGIGGSMVGGEMKIQ